MHINFKVVFETSLGLSLWDTKTDGSDVFLQTGLPPLYITKDESYLRSVIEGEHKFELTLGNATKQFNITLKKNNIDVMSQPMGTLTSLLFNDQGMPTSNAISLMKSNLMVFDCGFGTLDTFLIKANQLESKNTNPNLGMKRVLIETKKRIERDLGVSISLIGMQKILREGVIHINDLVTFTTKEYPINDYLLKANNIVCKEALESIKDYIFNIKYLIMTGGTSEAWINYFREKLKNTNVEIIQGNQSTSLPIIYANARGYYFSRLQKSRY